MMMVNRRDFVAIVAIGGLLSPVASKAQHVGRVYRIGFLGATSAAGYASQVEAFRGGLRDLGYVEGKNLVIEFRWAEGNYARLPNLAAELARLNPDVLVTHAGAGTRAAKQATATIPIVFGVAGEAVALGLVESIARPGGNATGSSFFFPELNAKRLEVLKEAVPRSSRVGVLLNPDNPANVSTLRAMEETARSLNVRLQSVEVRRPLEFADAFATLVKGNVEALAVYDDAMFIAEAARIAELARRNRLPTIGFVEYAKAGGLLAFGVNFADLWRRAAGFVDKIFKGAKPADLPVEQPTRFELIVNLRTAKAIGVTISRSLVVRADQLID
jgi:putative ABC transport system substrate-binding protein